MKAIIALVAFVFLFYSSFVIPSFAVTLLNTDFETASLSAWLSSGGGAIATISADTAKSGKYSIKVTHDKTSSYGYQTTIQNIEPGMFYEASAYAKSQDPNISAFFIRVAWYVSTDGSPPQLSSPNVSNQGSVNSDWVQLFTGSIQAPSNANSAKLRLVLTSKATGQLASAYFDDVLFKESVAPSPTQTPTPTATPSPIPSPTRTPSPTPIPIPTKIMVGFDDELASESGETLGTSSAQPSATLETPNPQVKTLGTSENILQKVFIILSFLAIISSAAIFIKQKWIK